MAINRDFPLKIGPKDEIDLYVGRLTHGERQLILDYEGNQYLTDGAGSYKLISDIDNITKIGDNNDELLPDELKGKTIVDMIKTNFTNANDAKSNLINLIGDTSLAENNSFNIILNNLKDKKQGLLDALINKKISGLTINDNLESYATAILNIQTDNKKVVKLNMEAGQTRQEVLSNPIALTEICTSVLKFIPGNKNVTEYTCSFDNSDSSNFEYPDTVIFNGAMKLIDNIQTNLYSEEAPLENGTLKQALININSFNNIDNIKTTSSNYTITGTNPPAIVKAKGDIDITNILSLNKINWDSTISGDGILKLVVSFDKGVTWTSYNGSIWQTIDIDTEFKTLGMSPSVVNALDSTALELGRGKSNTIRFAYYLEKQKIDDVVSNNGIELLINMGGKTQIASQTDFSYKLEDNMRTITYSIVNAGTYTFIYTDKI